MIYSRLYKSNATIMNNSKIGKSTPLYLYIVCLKFSY